MIKITPQIIPLLCLVMCSLMTSVQAQRLSENDQVQGMGADDTSVLYRQSAFFMMQVHLNQLSDMIKAKQPYQQETFIAAADHLDQLAKMSMNAFEEHSQQGYDIPSNAVQGIWQNQSDYKAAQQKLLDATKELVSASKQQPLDKVSQTKKDAVLSVAQSCKSCHDDFRAK